MLLGALPAFTVAQIVPGGANAPGVVTTPNGLNQVNINRPPARVCRSTRTTSSTCSSAA